MRKCFRSPLNLLFLLFLFVPSMSRATPEATIPEGTKITLQLNKNLSTRTNHEGDSFTTVVTAPVNLEGRVIIPKGAVVNCSVSRVVRPGKFQGKAQMSFRFQSIEIPGHKTLEIMATLVNVASQGKIEVHSEGGIEGGGNAARTVGKIAAPAVVGGAIGAIVGGGRGAGYGAGIGGGIGIFQNIIINRDKDLELKLGATLEIELNQALVIPAKEENDAARNR